MMSLDAMFDGTGEGAERIDWFRADQEWFDYSVETLDAADILLFGRITFDGMAGFWPDQSDAVAERMNAIDKIGFSRTPRTTTWRNATISNDPVGEVGALRAGDGGTLLILGSAGLAATLSEHHLIDEYRLAFNPVVLGAGVALFRPGTPRLEMERTGVRLFASGIVEIRLQPQP